MNKNKIVYYISAIFIITFSLAPILWCFIISLTPEKDMLRTGENIIPHKITFENYAALFNLGSKESVTIINGLINSLQLAFFTIIIGIPISILTAYAFVRFQFRYKKLLMNFILMTIAIPVFVTMIPVYSMFRNYNLLDSTFWTTIIYLSAFLPLNIWLTVNYLEDLPKEIWDSALLDGFSEVQMLIKIILPLSKNIINTSVLLMFIMSWKQYIIPMLLLSSYNNKPLTIVVSEFMTRDSISYGIIAVSGIIAVIPPAIFAIFFRKMLIAGLTSGSVKG